MFELLGLVFGGVSRLVQHWMELRDKDKERAHEAVMFDKQIELMNRKQENDVALRTMDAAAADATNEWNALTAAVEAQAREAAAAGGWVAKLSASVRPAVTYWLLSLYSAARLAMIVSAWKHTGGITDLATIAPQLYTTADGALLNSILGFWFVDRSLRKQP